MKENKITMDCVERYISYLKGEEKSDATIEKYTRDIKSFLKFINDRPVTKEIIIEYKQRLIANNYAIRSINSMITSVNCFMNFMGFADCKVKTMKKQREIFCAEEKELTKAEYMRLLEASKEQKQLNLLMQTICGTGIRVSELQFFTVESVCSGQVIVRCKNKTRTIILPGKLRKLLLFYAKKSNIRKGSIFVTKNGKPLDRSNIWSQMKNLCEKAGVNPKKVFPHNLRKLFARTFYKIEKDIAKLADVLGHGCIETTRIYIMSTGIEHRRKIERLNLII